MRGKGGLHACRYMPSMWPLLAGAWCGRLVSVKIDTKPSACMHHSHIANTCSTWPPEWGVSCCSSAVHLHGIVLFV